MILWHATPHYNLESIARKGLLTALAKGRIPAVWLHTRSHSERMRNHAALRHQCEPEEVTVFAVRVGRNQVRRFGRGIWFTRYDLRPTWLVLPFDLDAQVRLYAECPW